MKEELKKLFESWGYTVLEDFVTLMHENVLLVEKEGKQRYIVFCDTLNLSGFEAAVDVTMANASELYFVAKNQKELFGTVKAAVFKQLVSKYGNLNGARKHLNTICFAIIKILSTRGEEWEITSV